MSKTNKPLVSIIAALGQNRGIGKGDKLLWHIPDDLKRFKALTLGHPVIMGRKTFESIFSALQKPLPERTNIIVTKNKTYAAPECIITHSFEEALTKAKEIEQEEIFVIGGGELYALALPDTDRLYLTLINDKKDADVFFPDYSEFIKEVSAEKRMWNGVSFLWVTLER